jgi:hypothetical protein
MEFAADLRERVGAMVDLRRGCGGVWRRGARGMGEGVFYMVSVFLNGPAGIYGLAGPISVRPVGLYRLLECCVPSTPGRARKGANTIYLPEVFFPSDHPLFDIRATICIY